MYGHWSVNIVGEFDPSDWFGFIYLIEQIDTKRKYIGRKQFNSKTRKKITGRKNRKVTIKPSDWKTYTSSSDALNNDIVTFGKDKFFFQIIKLCKTKRDLGYFEVKEQFDRDVLYSLQENGTRAYYNNNIMSRYFVSNGKPLGHIDGPMSEEHKRKIGASQTGSKNHRYGKPGTFLGKKHSEETKEKLRQTSSGKTLSEESKEKCRLASLGSNNAMYGKNHSKETRIKMSKPRINKQNFKKSEETKKKMSEARKLYWDNKKKLTILSPLL